MRAIFSHCFVWFLFFVNVAFLQLKRLYFAPSALALFSAGRRGSLFFKAGIGIVFKAML